jgi:predicted nucleic acid-binding protein
MRICDWSAMRTAVDSSVILDVLVADAQHAVRSEAALRRCAAEGALIVGEWVLAEIAPACSGGEAEVRELLSEWGLEFVPSTQQSALLAGAMFASYLRRRRQSDPGRVVPDFLIGAHAKSLADRLLARDRGYFRDYFKGLVLLAP